MTTLRYALSCLMLILCHATGSALGGITPDTRHFSSADGLQGNTVKAMLQDDDGFIWMGGTGGLTRFDGYRFVDFTRMALDPFAPSSRHVGLLELDQRNRLLWVTNSTYSHGCIDLTTGRYVDYTDGDDINRTYDKYLFTGEDMWLYNLGVGIRHIARRNGRFVRTDYSREHGSLAENSVRALVQGSDKSVWGITNHTVFHIAPDGQPATAGRYGRLLAIKSGEGWVCCATATNDIVVYRSGSLKARRAHLPTALGVIANVGHMVVSRGLLYIFTSHDTYTLNLTTMTFDRPAHCQIPGGVSQGSVEGCQLVADRQSGVLWLFPDSAPPKRLDLMPHIGANADKGRIFNAIRDRQGRLVIASYSGGLFIYNPQDGHIDHYSAEEPDPLFHSNYLYAVMEDHTGCLWVAAEAAGVSCITPQREASAQYVYPRPGLHADRSNYVRTTIAAGDGSVLLSTNDNKLYVYHPATNTISFKAELKAELYAWLSDSQGRIWQGTRGNGLTIDGQPYTTADSRYHVPVNDFYDIKEDSRHRVWIATWKGGLLCTRADGLQPFRFKQFLTASYNSSKIHDLELSPDGYLYIATYNGLYAVDTRKETITERDFIHYHVANGQLPGNEIFCLKTDHRGRLWLGCLGNGALRCTFSPDHRRLTYRAFTRDNGLAANNILAITEDAQRHLWLTSEQGVSRIDSLDYTHTYRFSKNILSNSYSENSALLLPDGRLLFGTMNGLCIVSQQPADAHAETAVPASAITDLLIDGRSVYTLDAPTSLTSLPRTDKIELDHTQNTISICFSDFNYHDMGASLYRYYLEGVERTWRPVTNSNQADYGELRPGRYVFHLQSAHNGQWGKERQIAVVIRQPWYNTLWAWTVYLLLAAFIAYVVYRQWRANLQLQQEMKLERQTNEYRQYLLADKIIRNFEADSTGNSTVIVVSSDPDEQRDIEKELGGKFHTVTFTRGGDMLQALDTLCPALLICDEKADDMTGYELIASIRQRPATASLPVIMLMQLTDSTAVGEDDDNRQMESYAAGADDLLPKPFNLHLLQARTIQLISWNKPEVSSATTGETSPTADANTGADISEAPAKTPAEKPAATPAGERDLRFKRQLDYLIAQHLSDHDYTIDDLAAALQMGHTKFYGRVKEVTAMSPNKYMMQKRMATAAEMLLDGRLNISEISYKVGFLDQSYFNKCFKKQYGVAPSKYGK